MAKLMVPTAFLITVSLLAAASAAANGFEVRIPSQDQPKEAIVTALLVNAAPVTVAGDEVDHRSPNSKAADLKAAILIAALPTADTQGQVRTQLTHPDELAVLSALLGVTPLPSAATQEQ